MYQRSKQNYRTKTNLLCHDYTSKIKTRT